MLAPLDPPPAFGPELARLVEAATLARAVELDPTGAVRSLVDRAARRGELAPPAAAALAALLGATTPANDR